MVKIFIEMVPKAGLEPAGKAMIGSDK